MTFIWLRRWWLWTAVAGLTVLSGGAASNITLAAPSGGAFSTAERCVTLAELGIGETVVRNVRGSGAIRRFALTFPAQAVQGIPDWYMVRIHARIRVPTAARGKVLVAAESNGRIGARIQYRIFADGIESQLVSLAAPARKEYVVGRAAESRLENYLQAEGVKGGTVDAAFRVDLEEGALLDEVRILSDTCFVRTRLTPEKLIVEMQHQPASVRVGDRITVRIRITNSGTRAIGVVNVSAAPPPDGLKAEDPMAVSTTNLTGKWTTSFQYTATRVGQHVIAIDVGTAIQPTFDVERLTIYVHSDNSWHPPWWVALAAALVAVGAVIWWLLTPTKSR